jgi:predicted small metal-binding protein
MLRWTCLEAGCEAVVTAAGEDELVAKVNEHMGEAHASYELEEVVVANAEAVDDDGR